LFKRTRLGSGGALCDGGRVSRAPTTQKRNTTMADGTCKLAGQVRPGARASRAQTPVCEHGPLTKPAAACHAWLAIWWAQGVAKCGLRQRALALGGLGCTTTQIILHSTSIARPPGGSGEGARHKGGRRPRQASGALTIFGGDRHGRVGSTLPWYLLRVSMCVSGAREAPATVVALTRGVGWVQ
jgi:hypothetical protein